MNDVWITAEDGWQSMTRLDGSVHYRRLMSDTGTPRFQGAARRYVEVWVLTDGKVMSKSAAGFHRNHGSVEEAKQAVALQGDLQ